MGLLGRETAIVKCPACQATTKVVLKIGKATIRCPRCQASVPLTYARKHHADAMPREQDRRSIKRESESVEYGSEESLAPQHSSRSESRRRQRRYADGANSEFNYPDHTKAFTRIAILAIGLSVVLAIGFIVFFVWRESQNSKVQEYASNLKESMELHEDARKHLKKYLDPLEGTEAQRQYREIKGRLGFLAGRRRMMAVPEIETNESLRQTLAKLDQADKELVQLEEDVKKLAVQPSVKTKQPDNSIAAALGYSITTGPPASSTSSQKTEPRKPVDDKAVLIMIPDLTRAQWSEEFIRRFASIADDGNGQVTVNWSGDLLTLEVRPVLDPARYATRINFGRLLYYSRNDRSITLEFKPEKVNNYQALGDQITPILIELRQREKSSRIQSGLSQLASLKVDLARQAEVATVLESLSSDVRLDASVRDMAIKLIPSWSGKDAAELLIRLLDDKSASVRLSAINALVEAKAVTAASTLVKRWDKQEMERITWALSEFGSAVEKDVLPFLNNNSSITLRIEACKVLKKIGTGESLKPLLDLMNVKDQSPLLTNAARDAMKQILDRQTGK